MKEYIIHRKIHAFGHDGLDYFYICSSQKGFSLKRLSGKSFGDLPIEKSTTGGDFTCWQKDHNSCIILVDWLLSDTESKWTYKYLSLSKGEIQETKSMHRPISPVPCYRRSKCSGKSLSAFFKWALEITYDFELLLNKSFLDTIRGMKDDEFIVFCRSTQKIILKVLLETKPACVTVWIAPDEMTVGICLEFLKETKVIIFDLDNI